MKRKREDGGRGLLHGIAVESVEAVVFDLGGVFIKGSADIILHFGRKLGLGGEETGQLQEELLKGGGPWVELERGEISLDDFALLVGDQMAARGIRLDVELTRAFMKTPGGEMGMRIRPEIVEACKAVKAIKATMLLTNNIAEWRSGWHGLLELSSLFDHVIDSSEVGMRKPEQRIYLLAEELLGRQGPKLLFIDDLGVNLKPARERGWQTLKYDNTAKVLEVLAAVAGR